MKKAESKDPDMRGEYDFTGGVRGKHYKQFMAGTNLVALDADVFEMFPDSASVNRALRALGQIITEQKTAKRPRSQRKAVSSKTS
jgi:hypothetical protein